MALLSREFRLRHYYYYYYYKTLTNITARMKTIPRMSCSTSVLHRVKHVCRMCSSSLVTKRGQGSASAAAAIVHDSSLAGEDDGESIATLAQSKSLPSNVALEYQTIISLQCFDTVGWAAGRASGL